MNAKFDFEHTECQLCGSEKAVYLFTGPDRLCKKEGKFKVVKCPECGLVYVNPRPTRGTMSYFYPPDYAPYRSIPTVYANIYSTRNTVFNNIKSELKYRVLTLCYNYEHLLPENRFLFINRIPVSILKIINYFAFQSFKKNYYRIPVFHKHGKALDIGCGSGTYLLLLNKMGWEATGLDIKDNTAPEIKKADIKIYTDYTADSNLKDNSFHFISMWHSLEHLHSPLDTLRKCHRLLKKKGTIFIEVPNSKSVIAKLFGRNWYAWDLPRHLFHYTPDTLTKMLKKAGFNNIKIHYLSSNNLAKSFIYHQESHNKHDDIDILLGRPFISQLCRLFGKIFALLKASDIIFIKARKL